MAPNRRPLPLRRHGSPEGCLEALVFALAYRGSFTKVQMRQAMGLSQNNADRFTTWAMRQGFLVRESVGPGWPVYRADAERARAFLQQLRARVPDPGDLPGPLAA